MTQAARSWSMRTVLIAGAGAWVLLLGACDAAVEEGEEPNGVTAVPDEEEPDEAAVDAPDDDGVDPIVIGAAIGMSGFLEAFDMPPAITAQLAIEDLNEEGGLLGRPVEFLSTDTRSDPALGPDAALEAIERGADVLLVTCDFDFGSPAAIAADEAGIVSMALCGGGVGWGPAGAGPLTFSAGWGYENEAAPGAEFAYEDRGWESVYVLEDTTIDFTKGWVAGFIGRFTELAGEDAIVGHDTFLNDDESIATQISRLQAVTPQPDALVLCSYVPGGASAVRQIRAAGVGLPLLMCSGMDGAYWLDAVPDLSNAWVVNFGSYLGDDEIEKINELVERYEEREGTPPPTGYFVAGYSAVEALALGIERAGTTEGEAVRAALEEFLDEPLLVGPTTFTSELHVSYNRPMSIMALEGGQPRFVTRWQPERVWVPEGVPLPDNQG